MVTIETYLAERPWLQFVLLAICLVPCAIYVAYRYNEPIPQPPQTLYGTLLQDVDDRTLQDHSLIQGVWECVSCAWDGQSSDRAVGEYVLFEGEKMGVSRKGTSEALKFDLLSAFRLDATAVPNAIDRIDILGGALYGIYELDGDKLTICQPTALSSERPLQLTSKPGVCVRTLERAKGIEFTTRSGGLIKLE